MCVYMCVYDLFDSHNKPLEKTNEANSCVRYGFSGALWPSLSSCFSGVETGFLCVVLAVLELPSQTNWSRTQRSACLCLPRAGIRGVCYHV